MVSNVQIDSHKHENEMNHAFASSDFYQLLSLSMVTPTTEMGNALIEGRYRQDVIGILNDLTCQKQIINQLEDEFGVLEENLGDIDILLPTMRKEYTRLFNHPETPRISIYETLFLSSSIDEVMLFASPEALDAERCYQEAGIQLVAKYHEPADYLCTELEFMMYLYRQKGMALYENDIEQLTKIQQQIDYFEKQHIWNWVPKFFENVEKESELQIYQLISKLARCGLAKISSTTDKVALS
jgi:TorA maturation chaperone TorD